MNKQKDIAVILFSNSFIKESKNKSFYTNNSVNQKIHKTLFNKTLHVIKQTQLDYFIEFGNVQKGNSFGEKITNSLKKIFAKGYQKVIVLGTDTPDVLSSHINQAKETLNTGGCILGPSSDGGTYLIGLSKSQFEDNVFRALPWQTPQLLNSFNNAFLNITYLEELIDIDSKIDLELYIEVNKKFHHQILLFFNFIQKFCIKNEWIKSFSFFNVKLVRGPPQYSH